MPVKRDFFAESKAPQRLPMSQDCRPGRWAAILNEIVYADLLTGCLRREKNFEHNLMPDILTTYGPHKNLLYSSVLADVLDGLGHRNSALPREVRPLRYTWKRF